MSVRKIRLIGLTCIACVGMPGALFGQEATRYDGPVVDVHMHAFNRVQAPHRYCFPQPCEGAPTAVTDPSQLLPEAIRAMDRLNIVAGVIASGRSDVRRWMEGNEDRFIPGSQIGNVSEEGLARLRMLIAEDSVRVIGEVTAQYRGIPADDERLDPLFALAHELDMPVHIHVLGLGGSEDFPVHLGNPLRLSPVLGKYPGLRIYLENAGWPFLEEVTSLMYQYPSAYADISTILHLTPKPVARAYLAGLIDNGLGKRIMFGSDQMSWPEVIEESLEVIQQADFLSLEQKADILYNNAARFFRFSDEEIRAHHGR